MYRLDMGGYLLEKVDAIKSLYSQRERFILIGLTGRTGSGCTTVSNILGKDSMEELDLRSYKTRDYNSADERKYSVIYRYMKEGNKWKRFRVIEASSIIFSFILEETYGTLFSFIDLLSQKGEIKDKEILKKKILKELNADYDENKDISAFQNEIIDKKIQTIFNKNKDGEKNLERKTLDREQSLAEEVNYCIDVCKIRRKLFRRLCDINCLKKEMRRNPLLKIFGYTIYIHILCRK